MKLGFKVSTINGSGDIIHDFVIDNGTKINNAESSGFHSYNIIEKLVESISKGTNKHIYDDNYFTTLSLRSILMNMCHSSTCTF